MDSSFRSATQSGIALRRATTRSEPRRSPDSVSFETSRRRELRTGFSTSRNVTADASRRSSGRTFEQVQPPEEHAAGPTGDPITLAGDTIARPSTAARSDSRMSPTKPDHHTASGPTCSSWPAPSNPHNAAVPQPDSPVHERQRARLARPARYGRSKGTPTPLTCPAGNPPSLQNAVLANKMMRSRAIASAGTGTRSSTTTAGNRVTMVIAEPPDLPSRRRSMRRLPSIPAPSRG